MGIQVEIKTLRALVEVAEFGNISQAAISLGLTQSSLSRIISSLEAELGGPLFHRTGRGVTPTELGEAALPRARGLVVNSEQLIVDMRDLGQAPSGLVTLALLPSLMRGIAGDLFEQVRTTYPRVRLRMLEGFSNQIEEWLADGRADIGLLSRYRKSRKRDAEILTASQLMLVGIPDQAHRREPIRFAKLAHLPLVLPANPNGLRAAVDDVARRMRLKLNVVVEADSLAAQMAIISRQGCYAVLSPQTVTEDVACGRLDARRIIEPEMPRLVVMSTTTQHPLSRAAREVARLARLLIMSLPSDDAWPGEPA